jgi:hypothetical protein
MGKMDDSVICLLHNKKERSLWQTGLRAHICGDGGLHLISSLFVVCTVNENGKLECKRHKKVRGVSKKFGE